MTWKLKVTRPGGVESLADVYRGVYNMADLYLIFARQTLIDSPTALPHLMAGCRQALGLRDRDALVQVSDNGRQAMLRALNVHKRIEKPS